MLLNFINKRNILFLSLLLIVKILLPSISFADADKIFKENNKAVVVIIAYDQKGKPISQGSRLYNLKEGIREMSRLFPPLIPRLFPVKHKEGESDGTEKM